MLLCCFKRVPLVVAAPRSDQLLQQGEIAEKEGKVEREKRSSAVRLVVVVMVMDQWTLLFRQSNYYHHRRRRRHFRRSAHGSGQLLCNFQLVNKVTTQRSSSSSSSSSLEESVCVRELRKERTSDSKIELN